MSAIGIRKSNSPNRTLKSIIRHLSISSPISINQPCITMQKANFSSLIQLKILTLKLQFKMNKLSKTNRPSPPRDKQAVSHLEDTPPVQRRIRQIKFAQNENKDRSNFVSGFRVKPQTYESCQFECNEDYIEPKPEDQDFVKRSINILPSYLSQSQQGLALTRSQENVLRKPRVADKNANQNQNLQVPMPNSSLTFGTMKQGVLKNSLALNREYLEDKKIKNEILDEIIKNANKSNIMKSQDFGTRIPKGESFILCSNNDGKKAKYRIVGDDDGCFCSKCSIQLLQQGYQVEEINQQPTTKRSDAGRRKKDVEILLSRANTLQSKYKTLMTSVQNESAYDFQNARGWLEEVYQALMFTLEQMKVRDMQSLTEMQRDVTTKQKRQKSQLLDKYSRVESIKQDLDQLFRSNLNDLTDSQLTSTLQSYSHNLRTLENYQPEMPTVKFETIDEKLHRFIEEVKLSFQNQSKISEREESSIITKLDERLSDMIQERKPFRNLFAEEDQSEQSNNSNLFSSEVIEDTTASIIKHMPRFN